MTQLLNFRLTASPPRERLSLARFAMPQLQSVVERERAHFAREAGNNPRMASPATEDFVALAELV